MVIPKTTITKQKPEKTIKHIKVLRSWSLLLVLFNKHFGFPQQQHIEIQIPMLTKANIKINR